MTSEASPHKPLRGNKARGGKSVVLTAKQELLCAFLIGGDTQGEAAVKLKVSTETTSRWLKLPGVAERLQQLTQETISNVQRTIIGGGVQSARALRGIVTLGSRVLVDPDTKGPRDVHTMTKGEIEVLGRCMQAAETLLDRIPGMGRHSQLDLREGDRVPTKADESDGRSEVDMMYFAMHGRWPEDDAPPKASG